MSHLPSINLWALYNLFRAFAQLISSGIWADVALLEVVDLLYAFNKCAQYLCDVHQCGFFGYTAMGSEVSPTFKGKTRFDRYSCQTDTRCMKDTDSVNRPSRPPGCPLPPASGRLNSHPVSSCTRFHLWRWCTAPSLEDCIRTTLLSSS